MKVELSQDELGGAAADLVAIGLLEGGELPAALAGANGASDVPTGFKRLSILRPDGSAPVLVVGLGKREELDAEKLRVAAAVAAKEAGRLEASSLAWALPEGDDAAAAV